MSMQSLVQMKGLEERLQEVFFLQDLQIETERLQKRHVNGIYEQNLQSVTKEQTKLQLIHTNRTEIVTSMRLYLMKCA